MASLIDLGAKIGDYVLANRPDFTTGFTPSVDKVVSYSTFGADGEDKSRWNVEMALRDVDAETFWTVCCLGVDPNADVWERIITEDEARELAPDVSFTEYRRKQREQAEHAAR